MKAFSYLSKYILLEAKEYGTYAYPDVLVSQELRFYHVPLGGQQDNIFTEEGFLMTGRQAVDFLVLLQKGAVFDGKGGKVSRTVVNTLRDHFLNPREPFRGERLDGQFAVLEGVRLLTYHAIHSDGELHQRTDQLTDCLLEERLGGVDVDHWLRAATAHGLPPVSSPAGRLRYLPPQHLGIPWLGVDEYGLILSCRGNPSFRDEHFGVRKVILKEMS